MKRIILAMSAAAVLAGTTLASTTFASAQGYDDPPGSAWQDRGLLEEQGLDPNRYRTRHGYGAYGAYGYVPGPRYYQRRNPPGGRFQDRGIREESGYPSRGW
jgi:hypothetical protein